MADRAKHFWAESIEEVDGGCEAKPANGVFHRMFLLLAWVARASGL